MIFFLIVLDMMIILKVFVVDEGITASIAKQDPLAQKGENVCGAVIISDVVKENVQSSLCSGIPRQCGPDWLSGPPSPLPVTPASHYRVAGGENQLSDVVPQKPIKNNDFESEQSKKMPDLLN